MNMKILIIGTMIGFYGLAFVSGVIAGFLVSPTNGFSVLFFLSLVTASILYVYNLVKS